MRPYVKHSDQKAKTSNIVDLPLPLGPKNTVDGVIFLVLNHAERNSFALVDIQFWE